MLLPVPVDRAGRRRFSVSEIRQADATLRRGQGITVDSSDDRTADEGLPADDVAPRLAAVRGERTDARELGDIVHAILERLRPDEGFSAEQLVDRLGLSWPRVIGDELRHDAEACLSTYLESPVRREIAAARHVHREVEFYLPWPQGSGPPRVITGKLDCVWQSVDDQWTIIDYKTGRIPRGKSAADVLDEYEMQLAIYSLAVERLTGRWPEHADLLLLREGGLRISFAPASADWPRFEARITAALNSLRYQ
jgi:ATP-dependent exoDNAse (exonuclease V) beta subunit